MSWLWPLKSSPMLPDEPGSFGTIRKMDIHTGVDLYCELGQEVIAVEHGEVIEIVNFTGPNADDPSPWWNDTEAVLVRGQSGVVVYGEIESSVKVGDLVKAGELIGWVNTPVLKKFKGRPMVMLHLELRSYDATGIVWWRKEEKQPEKLLDPTPYLLEAAGDGITYFDMNNYNGKDFRANG